MRQLQRTGKLGILVSRERLSECLITSHYKITLGLLAMDLIVLGYGQISRKTPELTTPSPNFHTTPSGRR
ncbi:hypothetical protein TNCV_5040121 [Trichonephila clavipes]|nr:hypothetical protein TNCV_5040121 [Trichonephila clavipes]